MVTLAFKREDDGRESRRGPSSGPSGPLLPQAGEGLNAPFSENPRRRNAPFFRETGEGGRRPDEGLRQFPIPFRPKTLHEIAPAAAADGPAAFGFALALAAQAMAASRASGLIVAEDFALRENGAFYGPGLAAHGLDLDRLVFVRAPNALAAFAAMEEGLRSGALAFALAEVWDLRSYSLTVSRRLLLAARKGETPALLVQAGAYRAADRLSTAAETRFEIDAAASAHRASAGGGRGLPGAPAFAARIVKARLGQGASNQGASNQGASSQGPPMAFDPERVFPLHWHGETHEFSDPALSQPVAAAPADRPGAPAPAHLA